MSRVEFANETHIKMANIFNSKTSAFTKNLVLNLIKMNLKSSASDTIISLWKKIRNGKKSVTNNIGKVGNYLQ